MLGSAVCPKKHHSQETGNTIIFDGNDLNVIY